MDSSFSTNKAEISFILSCTVCMVIYKLDVLLTHHRFFLKITKRDKRSQLINGNDHTGNCIEQTIDFSYCTHTC